MSSELQYCPVCDSTFYEDDIERVCVSHGDRYSPPEYEARCPSCGEIEPDFQDAFRCEYCTKEYPDSKLSEVEGMCQKCFDDSVKELKFFVETYGSDAESKVLSFLLDF